MIAGKIKDRTFQLLPSGGFAFDSVQNSNPNSNVATPVAGQKMVLQSLTMTPLAATIVSIKPDTLSTVGEITIDQKTEGYTKLEIMRSSGQSVLLIAAQQNKAGQYKIPVNVSSLTRGTYSCRLQSATGTDFREIIIQK